LSAVPSAAVRIDLRISCIRERAVRALTLVI
jgi:hypothetical protein